jgi:hypothetical protein
MQKKAERFKLAVKNRKDQKCLLEKLGQQIKINDRNTNVKPNATRQTLFKRTFSRASALSISNVDFNYVGNTAPY